MSDHGADLCGGTLAASPWIASECEPPPPAAEEFHINGSRAAEAVATDKKLTRKSSDE